MSEVTSRGTRSQAGVRIGIAGSGSAQRGRGAAWTGRPATRLGFATACALAAVLTTATVPQVAHAQQEGGEAAPERVQKTPSYDTTVPLPPGIVWETNMDDPPIGSSNAIRGGTLNMAMFQYPLTFRTMGPNSNDAFSAFKRMSTMYLSLVRIHPTTGNTIPIMATHWSIQDDNRTIFFRLDRRARWSDGEPVTADDYIFTWEMMTSDYILDPFYNVFAEEYIESIDKVDDYTIRLVGTRPSWRPLYDYGEIWPTPRHATVLDDTWVDRTTNEPQIVQGPYVVGEVVRGESVDMVRVENWWGDEHRYLQGLYNFDRIHLPVIPDERELDYFRRHEIDIVVENTARVWNEEYVFPAVRNGWVQLRRAFVQNPSGVYGLHFNLEAPIFENKNFRKGVAYMFNFDRLNRNLMYNEYFRQNSFFEGTEYANPEVRAYHFDPERAREYFEAAGYHRPSDASEISFWQWIVNAIRGLFFGATADDDILVNDAGEKAEFTLTYGTAGITRHLTVVQQDLRRAGVEMRLQLLEPGTAFERGLERKYEATVTGRTTGDYPDPRQYLHSDFKGETNNNDIWGFGTPEVDSLIDTYENSFDLEERRQAMWRIDEIVNDEAFYVPFWSAPYIRLAYWADIEFPDFYVPRRTEQLTDWLIFWKNPEMTEELNSAMQAGRPLDIHEEMDQDPYGVMEGAE